MKVYVVMSSNIAEVPCELEGVFAKKADARKRFNEIKKDWKEWAKGSEVEIDASEPDEFILTNFDADEHMELYIRERELQ